MTTLASDRAPNDDAPASLVSTRLAPQLTQVGVRPSVFGYIGGLWRYRAFTSELVHAELKQRTSRDVLGAAWYVLAPLLQSGVYFIVFGVLLNTVASVENPVMFLSAGVFVFAYTSRGLMSAAKSVSGNVLLVRSLRFPRAVLPMSSVGVETALLVPTFGVLTVIALATGERPSVWWLLVPVILLLQGGFILGLGFLLARVTVAANDVIQVLPFVLRLWLYLSGVFYSFGALDSVDHPVAKVLLEINPMRAYIELVRDAYLGTSSPAGDWIVAIVWPIVMLVIGYVVFWRAEDSYGR